MTSASMVLIPRDDPVGKLVFVVIVLALGLLFFVALMALLTALMPRASARNRAALERTPWLAFLAGMAISLVLGGVAGYLFSGSYVRLLLKTEWIYPRLIGGIALSAVLLIAASFGATGTVACVGQRLAALAGRELSALRK
ncbi:MAG: hypothetical protein FJW35_03790, partial [Acidobacteria bacterium]|nr:hypothetical protein [Acidobacteriota bacterium]